MEKENKEIPFGAKDSELYKFEYAIPDSMEAIIDGNKVIIRKKESDDERIMKSLVEYFRKFTPENMWDEMFSFGDVVSYLKRQKDKRELDFAEGKVEGVKQTCQEIKDAMSLFEPKDLTPFELTFRDYIDSAIRYCLSGEGYQQYIKEWAADLLNLEKKKESQPLMRDGEIEDKKRDIVAAIRKYYPTDYAEYLTSFLKGLSPEDNSEDEYGQEMLGIAYKLMYEHIPENLRTKEFWDSLKFMREYTGKVAIIHSYEQPAEWSEEDLQHKSWILECLADGKRTMPQYAADFHAAYNWLKSLRPQPHWKPSEKQMEALRIAYEIGTANESWAMCVLKSLYNDLKSL